MNKSPEEQRIKEKETKPLNKFKSSIRFLVQFYGIGEADHSFLKYFL